MEISNNIDTIGYRLKKIRKEFKLTQTEFGKRVGVTHSHVSNMESGKDFPSDTLVKLICLEYGVNEDWFRSGKGEMLDEVYEYDREYNAEASLSGLLKLQKLLHNPSNVQYSYIAHSLDAFTDLCDYEKIPSEVQHDYLECIFSLIGDIHRLNSLMRMSTMPIQASPKSMDEIHKFYSNHLAGIIHDLDELYNFYARSINIRNSE